MNTSGSRKPQKPARPKLKKDSNVAERLLWSQLYKGKLNGLKFKQQHELGECSLDFYCPEVSLAVALDGSAYLSDEAVSQDGRRQSEIEKHGITLLRFSTKDVYTNMPGVLQTITDTARQIKEKSAGPSRAAENPVELSV